MARDIFIVGVRGLLIDVHPTAAQPMDEGGDTAEPTPAAAGVLVER